MPNKVRIKAARVPKSKKNVQFKVEVKGEFNFTAFVARQRVNHYLVMYVGNLLHAGEPDLLVSEETLQWDVPVLYSLPDYGALGQVGHIVVDVQNGDLKLNDSTPVKEMKDNASRHYQKAASHARAQHELSTGMREDDAELCSRF